MGRSIGKRWGEFWQVAADPWVIVGFVSAIAVGVATHFSNTPGQVVGLLVFSVISAVVGGRVTTLWGAMSDESALHARAKEAVRAIKLMLISVQTLMQRVDSFLRDVSGNSDNQLMEKKNYQEILSLTTIISEHAVNSSETWKDIVPEADITTQIGIILAARKRLDELEAQKADLEGELENEKGGNEKKQKALRARLAEKDAEIEKLRIETLPAPNLGAFAASGLDFDIPTFVSSSKNSLAKILLESEESRLRATEALRHYENGLLGAVIDKSDDEKN